MRILYTIALAVLLTSCESKPEFSDLEKVQSHLLIETLTLDNQSTQISNAGTANTFRKQEDVDKMLALKSEALAKAEKIPNSVLVKMHKDLPINFDKYKRGLALRIDNLKNRNVESEIEGSKLLGEWGDWYNANLTEVKVPKL